jgi:hypothetical protein
LVHDDINRRTARIAPDGRYIGLDSSGAPSREIWVYDRSVVTRAPLNTNTAALREALLRIPHDDSRVRGVLVDREGNLWVRKATDSSRFTIYDRSARRIGSVGVPRSFEMYQVFDTLVLGRFRDDDGVESIQIRRLTRGTLSAAAASKTPWL